jgi:hypothetical protein
LPIKAVSMLGRSPGRANRTAAAAGARRRSYNHWAAAPRRRRRIHWANMVAAMAMAVPSPARRRSRGSNHCRAAGRQGRYHSAAQGMGEGWRADRD